MSKLPKRLERQPLVESLIEARIGSAKQPMPDVLPGLVFSKLSDAFTRTEVLPLASVPREIRQQNAELRFKAHHRVVGEKFVLSIGDSVVALSRIAPYGGWTEFRQMIDRVLLVLEASELIESVIRYSMKSLNILPQLTERQLDMVRLDVAFDENPLPDQGFRLRTERNDENWVRIVEVAPNAASTTRHGKDFKGLQLNIDCIRMLRDSSAGLPVVRRGLDGLHNECKRLFFSLLTDDTLEALGPIYD